MAEESTASLVEYACKDQVATLTLNRPQRLNAFNDELVRHLADALRRFDLDPEAQVAVIWTTKSGRNLVSFWAVAGSLVRKKRVPPSAGSVPTHSLQFVGLLVGVVLIMGGLTYFPALSLGPVAEQVAMNRGIHYPAP